MQERRQKSPQDYSPEYSSPFSSQSLLPARFNQVSPSRENKGAMRYSKRTKENYIEAQLPVFQESSCSNHGQMIPQVTVAADSENGDFGRAILSDMSDEMLIKQLQLNMNEKYSSLNGFQSSSNALGEAKSNSFQPIKENTVLTNQHSPQKGTIFAEAEFPQKQVTSEIHKKQRVSSKKQKKASPVKKSNSQSKFMQSKTQSHTWVASTRPAASHPTKTSKQATSQQQAKKKSATNSTESNVMVENAPVPHPYPVQQQLFPKEDDGQVITDTFNPQKQQRLLLLQSSPNAYGDDFHDARDADNQRYVDVQSTDKKVEKLMTWSSASPAMTTPQISAPAFRTDFVPAFTHEPGNETIQEQPTLEQLQASTIIAGSLQQPLTTQANAEVSYSMGQFTPLAHAPVQEPQIMLTAQEMLQLANLQQQNGIDSVSALEAVAHRISCSAERSDSESMKQIRMINQLMQKKFTSNYSPDHSLDASDSLKDFSMGGTPAERQQQQQAAATANDYYQKIGIKNPASSDFEQNNLYQVPSCSKYQNNNSSIAATKDSISTCQNVRQKALPYTIHANLQQQTGDSEAVLQHNSAASGHHLLQRDGGESTLLNVNEKSQNSNHLRQFVNEPKSQRQSSTQQQRPGSTRQSGKTSPAKRCSAVYGQCQINPSEELYKPILRNGGAASGSKALRVSTESIPNSNSNARHSQASKAAMLSNCPYTGVPAPLDNMKTTTPAKPSFVSPSTSVQPIQLKRSDSRRSVRRNLEPQLATSHKQSLSPVSKEKQKLVKTAAFGTMIHKYAGKPRHGMQSNRSKETVLSSHGKSARLSVDSHQITNSVQNLQRRTRNIVGSESNSTGNFPVSRSLAFAKDIEASSRQGSIERQSQIFSKKNFATVANQASSSCNPTIARNSKIASRVDQAQTLTVTPATKSPVPRTVVSLASSTSYRTLADPATRASGTTVLATHSQQQPVPQTQPTMKASMYQLRRATEAMKSFKVEIFLEFERIKKPSAAILAIARMSCIFFEAIRNRGPFMMDQVESMHSWQQIQEYMRTNLTSSVIELKSILKQKVIQFGRMLEQDDQAEPQQKSEIDQFLEKIWETFFIESKIRVIRRFMQTNKLMKSLVQLIYAFICLTLNLEREFNHDNLLALTEQPSIKADEIKLLLASGVQQQQPQQQAQNQQLPSSLTQEMPRQLSQEPSKPPSIERGDENSYCSKCSCELSKQSNSEGGKVAFNTSKASKRMSRKSFHQDYSRDNSSEVVDVQIMNSSKREANKVETGNLQQQVQPQQQQDSVDMGQVHMFKTLDMVYVEQNCYASKGSQQPQPVSGINQQSQQRENPPNTLAEINNASSHSGHRASRRSMRNGGNTSSLEHITNKNQLSMSSGEKQIKAKAAMPGTAGGASGRASGGCEGQMNIMNVMDDYEASGDKNDSYGPFNSKMINADLNSNIAEQVVFEATKIQQQQPLRMSASQKQASLGRSATKVAGYMAATHSSKQQKNTQPISKRRTREQTSSSVGSDFVSVVRASVASKTAATVATQPDRMQRLTPQARIIQAQAQIQPQITAMTSRQKQQSNLQRHTISGVQGGKDVSPATRGPLSKIASNRTISQKKFASSQAQLQQSQQPTATTIAPTAATTQSRHVRTSTLHKSTASATAKIQRPSKSPLNRESSVKSLRRLAFGATQTSSSSKPSTTASTFLKSRKTKSQTNLKVVAATKQRPQAVTPKNLNVPKFCENTSGRESLLEQQKIQFMPEPLPQPQRTAHYHTQSSSERDTLFEMQANYLNDQRMRREKARRNIAQRNLEALRPRVGQIHADQFLLNQEEQQQQQQQDFVNSDSGKEHEMSFKSRSAAANVPQAQPQDNNKIQKQTDQVIEQEQQDFDQMPSFGEIQAQTEDMRRASLKIHEEEQSMSNFTEQAPLDEPSFTPEKQHRYRQSNLQLKQMQPMTTSGASTRMPHAAVTANQNCAALLSSSIDQPSCAINDSVQNAERACFIMQKAQDITENINSCYKAHNMPQINMATIEKLKMRRMHINNSDGVGCEYSAMNKDIPQMQTQQNYSNNLEVTPRGSQDLKRPHMPVARIGGSTTDQSCNIISTQTELATTQQSIEDTTSALTDQEMRQRPTVHQQLSFTDALNNLKAEVESLMKSRIRLNPDNHNM